MATPADAEAIQSIYEPYVAGTVISFEFDPPDTGEVARRLEGTLAQYPFLVAVEEGTIVGYAYGGTHSPRAAYRWSVDVSVYIDSARHRQGAGRALYRSLLALVTAQGYRRAYAGITLPNPASVGLHEAMGFRPVGVYQQVGWKFGAWHDVGWWQLSLDDSDAAPGEIRRVDELEWSAVAAILQA
ncbi:MAG: hypothetical protein QOK05_2065 [Chloroflexota bacterium]|nr:hypothetical protein [Chloroflexota bacterium]